MHFFSGPAAHAGLIVVVCLLPACSDTVDRTPDDGQRTPGAPSSGAPSASSPPVATSDPPAEPTGGSTSSGSNPLAVCEPYALCQGITSCSNYCYGPDCCTAYCSCWDANDVPPRLHCTLSCNPAH